MRGGNKEAESKKGREESGVGRRKWGREGGKEVGKRGAEGQRDRERLRAC